MMQIFCTQYDVFRVGLWHEVSVDPDGVFVSLFLGSVGAQPQRKQYRGSSSWCTCSPQFEKACWTTRREEKGATVAPLMIIVQPNVVVRGSQPFSASSRCYRVERDRSRELYCCDDISAPLTQLFQLFFAPSHLRPGCACLCVVAA